MKLLAILSFVIVSINQAFAARPTVNASNLYFSVVNCTSVTLTWSHGNGNARMIIGRKGNGTTFTPIDGAIYTGANTVFGSGSALGSSNDEFLLMNGVGTGSLVITNLKSDSTYYFSIFEHDNNSSNTLYLTANAPSINVTTYATNLDFTLEHIDSCERTNLLRLTNNSSSSIPGQTYLFEIGTNQYNADAPVDVHLNNSGIIAIKLLANNSKGCPNIKTKNAKIFPKRLVSIDYPNISDTIQSYMGHQFVLSTKNALAPFPLGISYIWDTDDGRIFPFSKIKLKYPEGGTYNVKLITNIISYNKETACKDTLYITLELGSNPFSELQWGKDTIYEDVEPYIASIKSTSASTIKWYFGDGDSSITNSTNHIYTNEGKYLVTLVVNTGSNIYDSSRYVVVLKRNVSIKNSVNQVISIQPNPSNNLVTISNKQQKLLRIYLYNHLGELLQTIASDESFLPLTFEQYPSGIYSIKVIENDSVITTEKIQIIK